MSCQVCKNKPYVRCDEKGLICLDCLKISEEPCFSHGLSKQGLSEDASHGLSKDTHTNVEKDELVEKLASALETIKQLQERENLLKHDIDVLSKLRTKSETELNSLESTPSSAPIGREAPVKKKGLSVKN